MATRTAKGNKTTNMHLHQAFLYISFFFSWTTIQCLIQFKNWTPEESANIWLIERDKISARKVRCNVYLLLKRRFCSRRCCLSSLISWHNSFILGFPQSCKKILAYSKLLAGNCLTVFTREKVVAGLQTDAERALARAVLLCITQTLEERIARFIS